MTGKGAATATVFAPAKINLYFHVTGRRSDGYHEVDGLTAFTRLGDELAIRAGEPLDIACDGPFARDMPAPHQNLVYRAAQALADAAGVEARAHIKITKNLPVASGMGGGSTDAAAVLKALVRSWDLDPDKVDLLAVGLPLGADMAVCLHGRTTYVGGIGEKLAPAPKLPPAGVLLVNPGVAVKTASVFEARRGGFMPPDRFDGPVADVAALAAELESRDNDLTEAAIRLCPVISDVLSAIAEAPGCRLARMTGSGATCFGLFDDAEAASAAATAIDVDGWWVAPTVLMTDEDAA